MRNNQPVTNREVLLNADSVLITRTDMQGKIVYANEEFLEISGFSSEELIGADHNIVRHPDMPPEAFAELWATVKEGKPWRQLVKNRTKAGDFYWVDANVTPLFKNGRPEGCLSVRYAPTRDQVSAAEELYDKVRRNKATLRPSSFLDKINFIKQLSIKSKLIFATIFFLIPTFWSTWLFINEKNIVIEFAEQEVLGVGYHKPITQLLVHIGEYSDQAAQNAKAGQAADGGLLLQMQKTIEADLAAVDAVDGKYGEVLKTTPGWQAVKQTWLTLQATSSGFSAEELFVKQSAVVESIYSLIADLNDNSNLMLDPDLDSFWLMDMTDVKLPDLLQRLIFLRGYLSLNYTGEPLSDKQKIDLMLRYRLAQRLFDKVTESAGKTAKYNEVVASALNNEKPRLETVIQKYLTTVHATLIENSVAPLSAEQYFNAGGEAIHIAASLYDVGSLNLRQLLDIRIAKNQSDKNCQLATVAGLLLISLVISFSIIRYFELNVKKITQIFANLADGDFKSQIDLHVPDEFGHILRGLQGVQVKLFYELSDAKDKGQKSLRIQNALDNVLSCVMLADNHLDIIYLNGAVQQMFVAAQADIRKQLPDFDAERLLGMNLDTFLEHVTQQSAPLAKLTGTLRLSLVIGSRHFNLVANPVLNHEGERVGVVVEWLDRTHEAMIEAEIEAIVEAVKAGELSSRIALDDKQNFFKKLSEGINELTDVIESVFKDIGDTMQSMSQGELTNRIERDYQGVYLSCKNDINTTIDRMSEIFGQVSESAHYINNSSQEIASGNTNLSQRAEQQAASLEETAASMEQLTGTVKHNADNALQANLLADNARELAEKGGGVVQSAVAAMQEINDSSNKISEIISVIDEIAFQTNLLALNASVEAARAGEQGRGFSVVATEVRNLAQRSATAAKESKELIQTSVQKVRVGADYVNQTGKALSEIVAGVKKVGDIVAEIAAASVEQSAGIGQVNQAVAQMDEMTQQNAALAEQASAASVAMSDLSINMVNQLSFFKTNRQHNTGSRQRPLSKEVDLDSIILAQSLKQQTAAPVQAAVYKLSSTESENSDDEWHDF